MAIQTHLNVQMILELSNIYEAKITRKEARDLSKSLISTLAKLGILKGGLEIITSVLSVSFTTKFISKSIQSITAGWLIKIVGLSMIEYLQNGQSWGDEGIQEVIDKIYRINKREEVIKNFIKEAISRIETVKDNQSRKKLPPFFN